MSVAPNKIISVDLAIRQSGIATFEGTHLISTATIEKTLGQVYKPLDCYQLEDGLCREGGLMSYLDKNAVILIEYNEMTKGKPRLIEFALEVKGYLIGRGYHVIMMNATHWMKVADRCLAVKRKSCPAGRDYNKLWISKECEHLFPKFPFKSQDEKDAALMGAIYLVSPTSF